MPRANTPETKPVRKTARSRSADPSSPGGAHDATVQQAFLDELIKTHTRVSIFLVNGVKLEGEIRSYDRYVILMKNAVTDKVYKHAVSTVLPMVNGPSASDVVIERKTSRVRRGAITTSARG